MVLAPEESDVAKSTPPWIAGFARGADGLIVLFPARSPSYPYDSLEDVLRHEIAHVLIARAAGERSVPALVQRGPGALRRASVGTRGSDACRVCADRPALVGA